MVWCLLNWVDSSNNTNQTTNQAIRMAGRQARNQVVSEKHKSGQCQVACWYVSSNKRLPASQPALVNRPSTPPHRNHKNNRSSSSSQHHSYVELCSLAAARPGRLFWTFSSSPSSQAGSSSSWLLLLLILLRRSQCFCCGLVMYLRFISEMSWNQASQLRFLILFHFFLPCLRMKYVNDLGCKWCGMCRPTHWLAHVM